MKLWLLLALIALARTETSSPSPGSSTTVTSAEQETTTSATTEDTSPKSDKGKRTLSEEASPQNLDYSFSEEEIPSRYVTQQYVQVPGTKGQQQYLHIPTTKTQQYAHLARLKEQQYLNVQDYKDEAFVPATSLKGPYYAPETRGQQYAQVPATKTQQVNYVPQKEATETKKQPHSTYTIQYVPAQHISHSVGILPKYQSITQPQKQTPKYQFVSKTQQQPSKAAAAVQNLVLPQKQQYVLPATTYPSYHGNQIVATPQYVAPSATTYLQSLPAYSPGHHVFSPGAYHTPTYLVPVPQHQTAHQQYHQQPQYTLQPVVMTFTLPGGHYLNTPAGQSALLAFLGGAGSVTKYVTSANSGSSGSSNSGAGTGAYHGAASSSTPYVIQRQQLTYLFPAGVSHAPVASVVPQAPQHAAAYSHQPQSSQQEKSSNSLSFRYRNPAGPHYTSVKG